MVQSTFRKPLSDDDLIKQWLMEISLHCVKKKLEDDPERVAEMQLLMMDLGIPGPKTIN